MESHGMVVKIKGRSCIVVTPQGDFKKVPLPKGTLPGIGQEIPLSSRKRLPYLKHFMVAASLLIFILAGQFYLGQTPPAAAFLTIDINPSIELGVSADRKVVSARSLNSDGEKILAEVKIKKHDLQEAVEMIVAQAVADHFLTDKDSNVILATLTVDSGTEPVVDLESVYSAIRTPVDSSGVDAEVIIEPVSTEMRQEAANSGMSTGRYLLLQRSDKKGIPVSVSEITSMSLGKLEKEKKVSFIELMDGSDDGDTGKQQQESKEIKENQKNKDIIKRGIYVKLNGSDDNSDYNSDDKSNDRTSNVNKNQKSDENVGKAVTDQPVIKQKEENQNNPERYRDNADRRKTSDGDKSERHDAAGDRSSHQQHGRND